ncbi:MAG: LPS assembly lipoprotein LptE [Rhodospirillales bacterium]|nr:LPS assembly lipoprotein LptE [Rhodospirillales bacterium]
MIKLIFSLAALGLLTGCGFKPIYGSAGESNISVELATIHVALIKDRIGQQLRNLLLDRINPGGTPEKPSYRLSVQLSESKQELAIKKSEVSTRANLTFTAKFQLQGLRQFAARTFSGRASIVTSYNILSSDFGTLSAEKNARRRAALVLASYITNRIAAYLQTLK